MDVISSEVTVHFSDSGKAVTDQDLFFFFFPLEKSATCLES